MIGRCYRPRDISYKNYGGRGITVCDEWRKPEPFLEWAAANGYSDELSLDRKDNNKPYGPDNCKWSTREEQNTNTRRTVMATYKGQRMPLTIAAKAAGLPIKAVRQRRDKLKWPEERWFEPLVFNFASR